MVEMKAVVVVNGAEVGETSSKEAATLMDKRNNITIIFRRNDPSRCGGVPGMRKDLGYRKLVVGRREVHWEYGGCIIVGGYVEELSDKWALVVF